MEWLVRPSLFLLFVDDNNGNDNTDHDNGNGSGYEEDDCGGIKRFLLSQHFTVVMAGVRKEVHCTTIA